MSGTLTPLPLKTRSSHPPESTNLALFLSFSRPFFVIGCVNLPNLSREKRVVLGPRTERMRGGGSGTTGTNPSSSLIKKTTKKSSRKRKTRSKTRKPKYLSLRLQFSADRKAQESSEMPSSTVTTTTSSTCDNHHSQLNLFPLHPENLVEEKDAHDENMAFLFSAADGSATTLTGLLGAAASTSSSDGDNKNHSTTTLSPSASLTCAYGRRDRDCEEAVALVRTAMRNKEREPSEERWVRYSEVVERRRAEDQEVSSCAADHLRCGRRNLRLSLKLDYQEILNAWSDKGPLYLHSAAYSPQTVPDIHDHFLASPLSNGISDGWGNSGGCAWKVPELVTSKDNKQAPPRLIKVKEELQQEQAVVAWEELNLKAGQRKASVQRYKEKRQNRLFSKRIRYQVRKLNAEKRPRLKGRFVKRS